MINYVFAILDIDLLYIDINIDRGNGETESITWQCLIRTV